MWFHLLVSISMMMLHEDWRLFINRIYSFFFLKHIIHFYVVTWRWDIIITALIYIWLILIRLILWPHWIKLSFFFKICRFINWHALLLRIIWWNLFFFRWFNLLNLIIIWIFLVSWTMRNFICTTVNCYHFYFWMISFNFISISINADF